MFNPLSETATILLISAGGPLKALVLVFLLYVSIDLLMGMVEKRILGKTVKHHGDVVLGVLTLVLAWQVLVEYSKMSGCLP